MVEGLVIVLVTVFAGAVVRNTTAGVEAAALMTMRRWRLWWT